MLYQELFPIPVEWLGETDESMVSTVAGWAEQEVRSRRLEHREDVASLLAPATQKLFVDIGLQAMLWPEESGGVGLESAEAAMAAVAVLETIGAADCGIAFLFANTLALQSTFAVAPHRDPALLERFAPLFCGKQAAVGALVLPGFTEGKQFGSFQGLDYQVKAEVQGDALTLTGAPARPQCSGSDAAVFAVVCEVGGGPAIVLVPTDAGGLGRREAFLKTGLAASVNSDLSFAGVEVPASSVAGRGAEAVRDMLSWYYAGCSAVCCGAMLASYVILKEWGDTRVIKGKGQVFKENPLAASLMGEIGGRCGTSRLLTYDLARMLCRPDVYGPAGGQALFATATAVFKTVSRAAMLAIDNAMELMASAGYATEWNLERYWRDVKTIETYVVPETVAETDMARHYFDLERL